MSMENVAIAFSDAMLENHVYMTYVYTWHQPYQRIRLIAWMLHYTSVKRNIHRSVVSVIIGRRIETSIASFSVQALIVSGPTLIKLSLYSFLYIRLFRLQHLVNIPLLLVETLPHFERHRQFVSAMISQDDLHVTQWTNVDSNFQILVPRSRQIITSTQ